MTKLFYLLCLWYFLNNYCCTCDPSSTTPSDELKYMPTKCESCQIFSMELENATTKISPKMNAGEAEAWLIEVMEKICDRMLDYRLHKEKFGLERFSKSFTKTAQVIKGLEKRGVEVKMDIPTELLDQPSLEIGEIKQHCEWLLEEFETEIEYWFSKRRQNLALNNFLCGGRFAKDFDETCLKTNKNEL